MGASQSVIIPVGGMSCQHCSAALSEKLASFSGVTGVAVDLAKGQATVSGEGLDIPAMRAAIEALGFDAGEAVL